MEDRARAEAEEREREEGEERERAEAEERKRVEEREREEAEERHMIQEEEVLKQAENMSHNDGGNSTEYMTDYTRSAQSLICWKVDENHNLETDDINRVEDSEEERVEDSENEDSTDEELSSLASQINCGIIIERQNESNVEDDGDTIPVLDDSDVKERELVEKTE